MKNQPKPSSGIPVVIIILVLVGVVVAGWYLYRSSRTNGNTNANRANSNSNSTPARTQVPTNAPIGASPPNMLGSPTAAVTVEEFADFQCGSCAATHPTMKEIQSIYGSKIKLVFRNYPLSGHDKAYDAATAAEAAGMQGKFWAMQDQLFTNQQAWSVQSADHKKLWSDYAEKIGLDVQRFQTDAAGMSAKSRVEQDMARGRALNVGSTPSLFINGQAIPFPEMNVTGLRRIIDAELQKAPAAQPASAPAAAPPSAPQSNSTNSSNSK